LARLLEENGERERVKITIVSPDSSGSELHDSDLAIALNKALAAHDIEFLPDFSINRVTANAALASDGRSINFNLLMLVPPFRGSSAASYVGITNEEGYINVDWAMRVTGRQRMYAIGDCVNFSGPKLGHMAVRQAEVAAANLAAEIKGHGPISNYIHEARFVIDESGRDSIYLHKDIWTDEPGTVRQGRFWSFAKRAQQEYWEAAHS
jgi:sulfide:quinone oxidoreductase